MHSLAVWGSAVPGQAGSSGSGNGYMSTPIVHSHASVEKMYPNHNREIIQCLQSGIWNWFDGHVYGGVCWRQKDEISSYHVQVWSNEYLHDDNSKVTIKGSLRHKTCLWNRGRKDDITGMEPGWLGKHDGPTHRAEGKSEKELTSFWRKMTS